MEPFEYQSRRGKKLSVVFEVGRYEDNHSLYIGLYDTSRGEPEYYTDVTVNLDGKPPHYCAYVDVANVPELAVFLEKNKIAYTTGLSKRSGFNEYPLYLFDVEVLRSMDANGLAKYEKDNGIELIPEPKDKTR